MGGRLRGAGLLPSQQRLVMNFNKGLVMSYFFPIWIVLIQGSIRDYAAQANDHL
jgi:hypothetical protein